MRCMPDLCSPAFADMLPATSLLDPRYGSMAWTIGASHLQPLYNQKAHLGPVRHGTSHGVGSFLNVHEGPQGLAPRPPLVEVPLKEGMVISNEPGYYADGKFGIRIENVQVIKMVETRENFGGKGYLGFEYFTMVSAPSLWPDEC